MNDQRAVPRDLLESRHTFRDLSAMEGWTDSLGADGRRRPYSADECLEGPEFSVVTETENGMHRVVAIVALPKGRDGDGPPPPPASESDAAVLRSLVRSLLDLAGHEAGRARTQVVLTAFGPRIARCRIGG